MADTDNTDVKKLAFERAIEELESIVKRLEEGKVPLEESVAIYERGEALKKRCEELLRQAEARVEKITLDASGKPTGSERSTSIEASVQVAKRIIVYVQGYDPRGLAEYYRMFRTEFRRTCDLYGLTGKIGTAKDGPQTLRHDLGCHDRRRRLADRHALHVPAVGRHHPQGFRAPAVVEDRAHVPHHGHRHRQRRGGTDLAGALALRAIRSLSVCAGDRLAAARRLDRHAVHASGQGARCAAAGRHSVGVITGSAASPPS